MDLGLTNRVALVTAASKGIGLAVARAFLAEGAIVALNARSDQGLGEAAARLDAGDRLSTHAADLTDAAATHHLLDEVLTRHGQLDALISNPPGPHIKAFLDTTLDDWMQAYHLLLRPAVQLAHGAAASMRDAGGGSIVFLTSTWVKQPKQGGVLSTALRAAVSALAKQMALELAPHNIRVNQVMPGATGTDRMKHIIDIWATRNGTTPDEERAKVVADIPMARWADADEIAATVVFLASERSSFTTGTALQIDGGTVRCTL